MVNYGGIDLNKHENQFGYYMSSEGHITPSSHIENMPKVTNMKYDSRRDVITADVTYLGQSYQLNFNRPTNDDWERLNGYYEILLEEDIVGGYEDVGAKQKTDVTNENANEPSRARQH